MNILQLIKTYYLSSSHPGMFAVASLTIFTRVT
jgi:hypothetical protein